jgi:quercetin dioxygenase-like cupin family protein
MFHFPNLRQWRGGRFSLVLLVASVAIFSGASQQPNAVETLQVLKEKEGKWVKAEPDNFQGDVAVQYLVREQGKIRVSRVRFQPGAHTNWHVHLEGQVLYIESGRGRVQKWGGEIREVGPGDVVYTAPGEKHWHGAALDSSMTHIATTVGATEWKEKVAEQKPAPKQ